MSGDRQLPVVVVGAGPVGLAAAAQLATRGLEFVVLESGQEIAAGVRDWAHVGVAGFLTPAAIACLLAAAMLAITARLPEAAAYRECR